MRHRLLAGAILTLMTIAGSPHAQTLSAGAGKAEIQIPANVLPLDGFTAVHDSLNARVLLLNAGSERIGIVAIDQTSMSEAFVADMKQIVSQATKIPPENLIVCASHGFSSPHVFPPEHTPVEFRAKSATLEQAIETAVRSATDTALATVQPAHLGFGSGTSRVAVNRDVHTPFGWWLGGSSAGFTDPTLGVLRIDGANGKPLAVLMNLGVQSSVLDFSIDSKGDRVVSSDLAGAATRNVETYYDNTAVALFLIGAAGDQAPVFQANRHVVNADGSATRTDIHDAGYPLLNLLGKRLAQDTLIASDQVTADPSPQLALVRKSVEVISQPGQPGGKPPSGPVMTSDFQPGDKIAVPVVLIRIGDTAIVGVREELNAATGAWIREHSPFAHTMVVTMVDGAAKYMPDAASYDKITYEARSSRYAKGSAETLASTVVVMLTDLHDGKQP